MRLDLAGISDKNRNAWEAKGYELPDFDIDAVRKFTYDYPIWVHFGAGNIFRAFHAMLAQNLLNSGAMDRGITCVEGYDYEIIEKMNRPHDELSLMVTLRSDGTTEKTVVGSIAESCILDSDNEAEFGRLKTIFASPSLQMATFTITEKGYSVKDASGNVLQAIMADFEAGPAKPGSYLGKVVSLLYSRYEAGAYAIAMVSTDNCSHNGDKLHDAVYAFAKEWTDRGLADKGFLDYVEDPSRVSFPWSMIDKITPRPDKSVEEMLEKDAIEGLESVITSKNTYVASFVNAEECEYLVIEDAFPNGRPPLEKAGVIFTSKETVDKVERMKVCTCLNPLHTALAVYGCLLGYEKISDEMKDEDLVRLIRRIGYTEGLPVVTDPRVIDPKRFIDTVVGIRLPNPFMPDTPQRIATDTSQKLPIRFGETVKNYIKNGLDIDSLKAVPLVFAGWLRYLMAVDDKGREFELSSDPRFEDLLPIMSKASLGMDEKEARELIAPILKDDTIFAVDLWEAGLGERVSDLFVELTRGTGAVRKVLSGTIA
ncbi:MAG: mannitol dehydrogenase family protein [Lachnospiraceae bacterium]|nr:mannitol dehydrogenase family protein [Lachnospiraceae bacterium]